MLFLYISNTLCITDCVHYRCMYVEFDLYHEGNNNCGACHRINNVFQLIIKQSIRSMENTVWVKDLIWHEPLIPFVHLSAQQKISRLSTH